MIAIPYRNGIQNIGNTCFINAPLQSLMQTSEMSDIMLNMFVKLQEPEFQNIADIKLLKSLSQKIVYNWNNENLPNELLNEFVRLVCLEMRANQGSQEDAQEFVLHFLDYCDRMIYMILKNEPEQVRNSIRRLFDLRVSSSIRCSRQGHFSIPTSQWIRILSVSIMSRLEDSIDIFFQPQRVERYRCARCDGHLSGRAISGQAQQFFTINEFPQILIIQLKRFKLKNVSIFPFKVKIKYLLIIMCFYLFIRENYKKILILSLYLKSLTRGQSTRFSKVK